ncbi:MAG TPA: glycosyltransferase family 1 protein [Thermoanaerobaculia bacterium]|nr:glycosyltransferase family 1 protein [Thermoanaerobaculia bacterium]
MPRPSRPTLAVDLRALVPEETGIGVYTRNLLLALARQAGAPRLLGVCHRRPRGAEELEAAGVAIEVQPAPLGVIWQQLQLPRRLARGDVDLFWSPLMTLPLASRVPAVVTIHDLTTVLYPETHTAKVRLSILPFLERSLDRARRVIAVSEATAADLAFHFPACAPRVRVVYEGVDPSFTPGSREEVAASRRELGAPEGYILYIGTLEPRKNVGVLLSAWESLRRDDPATPPLVLAGGAGWQSDRLRTRIAALGSLYHGGVRYLGRVDSDRLLRLFQGARAFAYPSFYEGFGLPPLEALACGVPTVVSTASSLPEVVGDAALLVGPHDALALAAALRKILGEPARAADLARRGPLRAARFRWEAAAREMAEVFLEALD